jgi:hypothetical protein
MKKKIAGLEGWPVLWDFFCTELLSRDFKTLLISREVRFREVLLYTKLVNKRFYD